MNPAAVILTPLQSAAIIRRATAVPYVVMATYERANGDIDTVIDIVLSSALELPPLAEDAPGSKDAVRVVKASIFPATMFLDLKAEDRAGYGSAFRAYQLWSRARAVNKAVSQLQPSDFDQTYMAWSTASGWPPAVWLGEEFSHEARTDERSGMDGPHADPPAQGADPGLRRDRVRSFLGGVVVTSFIRLFRFHRRCGLPLRHAIRRAWFGAFPKGPL